MPLIEVEEVMPVSVERMWTAVNDVEAYPRLMEHVRSLELLEEGPDHRLTAWEVDLKGCTMRWVERETIDPARHRLEWRQVEGDLAELEGHWQLSPIDDGASRAALAVRFEIGIPMLSAMLDPVAADAVRENSRQMLSSLAAHAAAQPA